MKILVVPIYIARFRNDYFECLPLKTRPSNATMMPAL